MKSFPNNCFTNSNKNYWFHAGMICLSWLMASLRLIASGEPDQVLSSITEFKAISSDSETIRYFGDEVAIDGDTALVSVQTSSFRGRPAIVYVFVRENGGWIEEARITSDEPSFGNALAICGDTALIGAFAADENGDASGSAFVYVRKNGQWTQEAKLTASDGGAEDIFGFSVSLDGDTALIGAAAADGHGAAYIFERSGNQWTETERLVANDPGQADFFGVSVSIEGNLALIGSPWDRNFNGAAAGSAYVFEKGLTGWNQIEKVIPNNWLASIDFGFNVSLSGDTLLIASSPEIGNDIDIIDAYVFERENDSWNQKARLVPSLPSDQLTFVLQLNRRIALSGDCAVISSSSNDDNQGVAFLFRKGSNGWFEETIIRSSDGEAVDSFGECVALDGSTVLVGAPFNHLSTNPSHRAGAVYFYDLAYGEALPVPFYETDVSFTDSWYRSWFGGYRAPFNGASSVWIYHANLGWTHITPNIEERAAWFWLGADIGWGWSSDTLWPYIYQTSDSKWMYYYANGARDLSFYDINDGKWLSFE